MRILFAALLLLQAAPAQSEADRLEAALKKFGDRNYRVIIAGQDVGSLSMTTRVEKEGGRSVAVFKDRGEMKIGDEHDGGELIEKASMDGFRLISHRAIVHGEVGKEVTVAGGRAVTQVAGIRKEVAATPNLVGPLAVFRLLAGQEQKVGAAFKFDMLSASGEKVETGHDVKCVAREDVEVGGKKRAAFKWIQKFQARADGPAPAYILENHYWVDPNGYVLRTALHDDGKVRIEFTLDAK